MEKVFYLRLFVILLFVLSLQSFAQGILPDDKIQEIIKHEVNNKRSPGIVVGVIDENGKRIYSYGKLSKESEKTPDGNTIYEIGSITKVFTSLLLEDMAEHGELNVDDPISKFLPKNVKTPTKDGKEITLLDLSTQTSGLPRMPNNFTPKDFANPFADYTPEKLYDYLSNYKLTRGIGEKYEYSNTGVGLLGHILTLKTGADYETLIRTRICEQLKMTSTVVTLTPEFKQRLATGYDQNNKPVKNWDFLALAGCGAIKSTVNDMLLFAEANLGLVKTNLSPAMEKIQRTQHSTTVPDLYIGMGWHIWKKYDKEIIWHNGGTGGYRTFIGLDKKNKRAVVVFSNSTNGVDDIGLHLLESKFELTKFQTKEPIIDTLMAIIEKQGIEEAINLYSDLKREHTSEYQFTEDQLNTLGYQLLQSKRVKEAIEILRLNTEMFPNSFNAYDSLGEAYMANGDKELSIESYKKSVELNPKNANGIQMLEKLKSK